MNHDATHCLDYKKSCPKSCYRAQLTKELKEIDYTLPVSWMHYKGSKECPKEGGGNMKVSQLLHNMDKNDLIVIDDYDAPIDKMTIYKGMVRGIVRDNPINKMHIESICADNDTILVLATHTTEKGGEG